MLTYVEDDRHLIVVYERTLAEKLQAARPDADLLTHVAERIWSQLYDARRRAEKLGCCWDAQRCYHRECHGCRCEIPGLLHLFEDPQWEEPAPPVVVRHGDEGPDVHLHGAQQHYYRAIYEDAKLLPELIRHWALHHACVDLRDADDAGLRHSSEARLAELKGEIEIVRQHELRNRQLR